MYVCMYVCTRARARAHTHTCTDASIHAQIITDKERCTHIWTHPHAHTHTRTHTHRRKHTHTYIWLHMHIHTCVRMRERHSHASVCTCLLGGSNMYKYMLGRMLYVIKCCIPVDECLSAYARNVYVDSTKDVYMDYEGRPW